jgi:DNA-binding HxlR family transcriptional regulator
MKTNPVGTCPIEELIEVIGGRWKVFILWWLQDGAHRFTALKKKIPLITQKMLTQQLRELERDGFVARKVFSEIPPRVEYSPTPLALSLKGVLTAMCDWSSDHMAEVQQARKRRLRSLERVRTRSVVSATSEG